MTIEKRYLSANELLLDSWRLASAVREADWRPDWLVALWRGGAPAGVAVHEFLKVSGWNVRHVPLKSASYTGIGQNDGEVTFTLGDETFGLFKPGERVLFVDDVFDTGKTAKAVRARMDAIGVEMRLACVYWKPACNQTDLQPDYFAQDVGDTWLVFPHEIDGLCEEEVLRKDPALAGMLSRFALAGVRGNGGKAK